MPYSTNECHQIVPACSAHDQSRSEEKPILGKMPMREKQTAAHPAGAWEEVRVGHEATLAEAIGVAKAIRKVRHVGTDKAVERRSVVMRRAVTNDCWRGLLNDNTRRRRWRHGG